MTKYTSFTPFAPPRSCPAGVCTRIFARSTTSVFGAHRLFFAWTRNERSAAPRTPTVAELPAGLAAGWDDTGHALWLPLRPPAIALVALVLAVPLGAVGARLAARWTALRPRWRRSAPALVPLAAFLVAALAGNRPGVIKAAVAYSGVGDPLTRAWKRLVDRDRDGHSPWFGGGDCDDGDAHVHPGASDIPDDGVDQNCVAGDAKSQPAAVDPGFVPLPPGVPADANIVLITIDTLRADHVSSYGYRRPTTPALDAVAAAGTRFAAAWAHAPSTRYSMPAILTGRLPLDVYYDHGVAGWPGILPRATTLADPFRALRHRGLLGVSVTALLYNFGFFTLLAFTPFPLNMGAHGIGLIFFGWGVCLAFTSVVVAPRLQRRFGTLPTLIVNLLCMTATLAVMVAGRDEAVAQVADLLAIFGKLFRVGPEPGQAQLLKLLNNMLSSNLLPKRGESSAPCGAWW